MIYQKIFLGVFVMPVYSVGVYSVGVSTFDNAEFFFSNDLASVPIDLNDPDLSVPATIEIQDDDGVIDFADPTATSVSFGDLNEGALVDGAPTFVRLSQTVGAEVVEYSFVLLERESVGNYWMLPIDPVTGRVVEPSVTLSAPLEIEEIFSRDTVGLTLLTPPTASDDVASTQEDVAVLIDVLANDTDPDGGTLTISAVGPASNGTTAVSSGQILYTPDTDFNGTDSFNYDVTIGGTVLTATVDVTVAAVADTPVAVDDGAVVDEDGSVVVAVLANDSDADGDVLLIDAIGSANNGTVTIEGTSVRYTPNADFNGSDSFSYTVEDGTGLIATAIVDVTVSALNDAPMAGDDTASVDEDASVSISVLSNDLDVDGDALTITAVGAAANGTVVIDGGTLLYTPDADFNGSDGFTYTISDGTETAQASVSVSVDPVADPPLAVADTASTNEDESVSIAVLSNDSEGDGGAISIQSVGAATKGSVVIDGNALIYTPDANANGEDSFAYTIVDLAGETNEGTVTVAVAAVNDAPMAGDDTASVDEDASVSISVLSNDLDVDGDALTITAVGAAANGTVVIDGGTLLYTPDADFNGSDGFTYTISDGTETAQASVSVSVDPINDAPIGGPDSANLAEDGSVLIDVLPNDSDPEGDTLSIVGTGPAANGSVVRESGQIRYVPNADFNGTDSFVYLLSDGTDTTEVQVSVTVTPEQDSPEASDDETKTAVNTAVLISVLSNDTDVDGDTLEIVAVGEASSGSAVIDGRSILYTPDEDFVGVDSFTYSVTDGTDTVEATVSVNVDVGQINVEGPVGGGLVPLTGTTEIVTLNEGPNSLVGDPQDFFNDSISGFGSDDTLVFNNAEFGREDITVTQGSAILDIDADGDGAVDGRVRLEGDFTGGDFMAVARAGSTHVDFVEFLPQLGEGATLPDTVVNGVANQTFLTGDGTASFQITLLGFAKAKFSNTLGVYEIDTENRIVDVRLLFENVKDGGTALVDGVEDGNRLGFFVVANGADLLDDADSFDFVDRDGAPVDLDTATEIQLVVNGSAFTARNVFHSFDLGLNPGDLEHVVSGVDNGGQSMVIGFEDRLYGGDRDYQDVAFEMEIV